MKTLTIASLLLAAVAFLATACGDSTEETAPPATTALVATTADTAPEPAAPAAPEPAPPEPAAPEPEPEPEPEPAPPAVPEFPVTVADDNGEVTISTKPARIVSMSPTATEMLFAVGAGSQVTAADSFSNYPAQAPTTDLSAFTPNVEAIASYDPDLVVISYDPGDLVAGLQALGIEVLTYAAAPTLDDAWGQMISLGQASGNTAQAQQAVAGLRQDVDRVAAGLSAPDEPLSYYLELDPGLWSVTTETFIGQIFGLAGLSSIADAVPDTAGGYPQLSQEFILDSNPDLIFVTDCCGDTPESLAGRAGWEALDAVSNGRVAVFDADIISRWGPRVVELLEEVAEMAGS